MTLHVYSLKKQVLKKEVASVNLKTADGEITVLDHHRPLISFLGEGPVRIVDTKGGRDTIEVSGGFLEVRPGEINIMVD